MRYLSLLLTGGPIEDAFIYRTSLYCWTFDRRLRIYQVADLERSVRQAAEQRQADELTYALFHSRGLGASPAQVAAWKESGPGERQNEPLVIDAEAVPYVEIDVRFEANALLDLLIFYDRLYLASDNGLLSIDPFDPSDSGRPLLPEQRIADPCFSAGGGLGAVTASCGPKGLRILLDDHRWAGAKRAPRKAASESIRAEVGAGTVVNHRSRADFEFLAGTTAETPGGRLLTSVKRAKLHRSERASEVLSPVGGPDFTLWDRARLLAFDGGRILSLSVIANEDDRRINNVRELGRYDSSTRVISATRVGRTYAIETDESVVLAGDFETRTANTGPVVSLRAYPKSRRYLRLISATSGAGLWLIGVDDQERWRD